MLNRFKNKLVNIVGGISNPPPKDNESNSLPLPQDVSPFPYARPQFLNLSPDEVQVSADHISRPILVPRNNSALPWNAGYAEVINAGKTKVNEDQARADVLFLPKVNKSESVEDINNGDINVSGKMPDEDTIPLHYFAVFDGHAGTGAALMAVNILHLIIQDKLLEVKDLLQAHLDGKFDMILPGSAQSPGAQSPVTPPFSPPPETSPPETPPKDHPPSDTPTAASPDQAQSDDLAETDGDSEAASSSAEGTTEEVDSSTDEEIKDINEESKPVNGLPDLINGTQPENDETENNKPTTDPGAAESIPTKTGPESPTDDETSRTEDPNAKKVTSVETIPPPRYGMSLSLHRFNIDNLIEGALESSFFDMDSVIARERRVYRVPGGCTAVASMFFNGKLYVANAGDSRAIVSCKGKVIPMSYDFTPETDRQRIQMMAWHHPELLCNMFCPTQFAHRVTKKDVGKRVLHRDGWRNGWSYKTVGEEDLQMPLIYGVGKKARLLATIGVSRGFGDHDLRVYESDVFVKPFMSCAPQVCVLDLTEVDATENDVLIIGTDGLWDVTSSEKAASIVDACLTQFASDDPNRYVSAAQELVMHARGVCKGGAWRTTEDRMASSDDISVFVIPLNQHINILSQSSSTESTNQ